MFEQRFSSQTTPSRICFIFTRKEREAFCQGWRSSAVVLFHHPPSGVVEVLNILDAPHEGPLLRIHYCLVHPRQLAFKDCAPFLTTAFLWYCAKEYQAGFVTDQLDSRLLVSSCFKTSVGGLGGRNNNSLPSPPLFFLFL